MHDYVTQDLLKDIFTYCENTGNFHYKKKPNSRMLVGDKAGCFCKHSNYERIGINGKKFMTHRLVWLYKTGIYPTALIDHIDGNTSNNTFKNLREASHSQNNCNKGKSIRLKPYSSSYKGVYFDKKLNKFIASIKINGKRYHLGKYIDELDAAKAYADAAKEHHKEFHNLG